MFEKLDQCPLCNSGHFHNYIICKDHTVSQEDFAIVKCDKCNFLFTNPRPSSTSLDSYYESEDYVSHQNKSNNITNLIYRFARKFTLKGKLKLINSFNLQTKQLLDIGCGTGHFINLCKSKGWHVDGVEPNETARNIARSNHTHVVEQLSDLENKSYDVITMWHVLEHIPDINDYLNTIHRLLNKNGRFIVAVPNISSYDASYYKDKWAAYDVPRHLYHFSQQTMAAMMKKHGFKVIATKPMKLDAFYVSLLSEKYKQPGVGNYVQSILKGSISNSYARKHQNNYSSLIYIIRKQ